jgi:uncharacterized protein
MNVDQVLQVFRGESDDPREAVQWALDHWDTASDRLLSKLRMIVANWSDDADDETHVEDGVALFYLVHLFAEKRDSRAYAPLCQRLGHDKDQQGWLGNQIFNGLSGLLINLCDGDLGPIQRLIEGRNFDEAVRAGAMEAYGYLVRFAKAATEEEARDYLRDFYENHEPHGPAWIWAQWAETVARLGFQDFASRVARLSSKNWISEIDLSIEDFHMLLAKGRSDPEAVFADDGIEPFGSTIALIDSLTWNTQRADEESDGEADQEFDGESEFGAESDGVPYINPVRDVGRNDPCPCGSGKKYKKCCLAA